MYVYIDSGNCSSCDPREMLLIQALLLAELVGFLKLGVPLGVLIMRTIVFWGLYWGLILGKYHLKGC